MLKSKIAIATLPLFMALLTGCNQSPAPQTTTIVHKVQTGDGYKVKINIKPEATKPVAVPKPPSKPYTGEKVSNYIISLHQALDECNSKLLLLDKAREELYALETNTTE